MQQTTSFGVSISWAKSLNVSSSLMESRKGGSIYEPKNSEDRDKNFSMHTSLVTNLCFLYLSK
jgi:hypothetical protein